LCQTSFPVRASRQDTSPFEMASTRPSSTTSGTRLEPRASLVDQTIEPLVRSSATTLPLMPT